MTRTLSDPVAHRASARTHALSEAPLRVLMMMHMPWRRELGAPRVSIEIAEELEALGHHVDHFDLRDAFPRRGKFSSYFEQARFPARAIEFVRRNASRYDVIQAEQGNLPVSKRKLGFGGMLVARSNGLAHFYDAYDRRLAARDRAQGVRRGTLAGNLLRWSARRMSAGLAGVERSFAAADAIVLINHDEHAHVSQLGFADKSHLVPNGLSEQRFADFDARRGDAAARYAARLVAFVGGWTQRKGSQDLPRIVRQTRAGAPATQFLLLGTGVPDEQVRASLAPEDRPAVRIIANYASEGLPALLAGCTAVILPAYIEGFPIAVLEAGAAALPIVAYDVPGPRELLRHVDPSLMTPAGDADAFAARLCGVLSMPVEEYRVLSDGMRRAAHRFRWRDIARQMLGIFRGSRPNPTEVNW